LPQIQAGFEALGINATCDTPAAQRAHCRFEYQGQRTQRTFDFHLVYSDETDTVYLYAARYLTAPAGEPGTAMLLQRLMTYNWRMLSGKFEWDESDGEVRLSVAFHTDSNFDQRTFRSLVRGLALQADNFYGELSRLLTAARDANTSDSAAP